MEEDVGRGWKTNEEYQTASDAGRKGTGIRFPEG